MTARFAGVQQRGATWYFVIDAPRGVSGKRKQIRYGGFKTKRQAAQKRQQVRASIAQGTFDPRPVRPRRASYKRLGETVTVDPAIEYAVYVLTDTTGRVIYVGKSTNWLARLGQHAANADIRRWIYEITVIECESAIEMADKETELIKTLQPKLNRHGNPAYVGECPVCGSRHLSSGMVSREVVINGRLQLAYGVVCDRCGESWGSSGGQAKRLYDEAIRKQAAIQKRAQAATIEALT